MKWFKHSTGSHDDPDISDAMDEFGHAGYAVFFITLEIYGDEYNHLDLDGWLTLSRRFVARKLRLSQGKVEQILNFYSERQRIITKTSKNTISINCPKFVEIASNWTKRKNPLPTEALQRPYVAPTAKEEEEKKKRREEEENKEPPIFPLSKPSQNPKEPKKKPTTLPVNFSISERVREWAGKKKMNHLDEHLENFVSSCQAKGYEYLDWDAAFMNAIRQNWAKVGGNGNGSGYSGRPGAAYPQTRRGKDDNPGGLGIPKEYKPEAGPIISEEERTRNLAKIRTIINGQA